MPLQHEESSIPVFPFAIWHLSGFAPVGSIEEMNRDQLCPKMCAVQAPPAAGIFFLLSALATSDIHPAVPAPLAAEPGIVPWLQNYKERNGVWL
jgi:hypothetical protein